MSLAIAATLRGARQLYEADPSRSPVACIVEMEPQGSRATGIDAVLALGKQADGGIDTWVTTWAERVGPVAVLAAFDRAIAAEKARGA